MRATLTLIAAALLALLTATPAGAALSADSMFEPTTVVVIDLTLPPASVAALEADPEGDYVEGTFALAETTGTPAGTGPFSAPLTVGIRLKGDGSFRDLDGKAAFKIKFNEFVKGQKFLGLKKLTLNNMVQDPSMLHEALAYEAFGAAGVPAPSAGYADVRLNGEEFGLHLNLETLDDVALEKRFGAFEDPPQHLYEAGPGVDVTPGGAGSFEVDEGDEDDRSDLEALIDAVNAPSPPGFAARVATVADLAEMRLMWAVEKYIGQWDGYSGRPKPHNYFLYSDPAGSFRMLPWGTDQAWTETEPRFGSPGGLMFEACLAEVPCAGAYREDLEAVRGAVGGPDLDPRAAMLAAQLAPWQALETLPRRPFDQAQVARGVAGVRDFVARRPAELEAWLRGPTPPPDPAAAPPDPTIAANLSPRLKVDRSRLGAGVLVHSLAAPGPGTIAESATIVTAAGPLPACRVEVMAMAAGPATLRCRLSATVRRHLGARRLRLRVTIRFHPDAGPDSELQRTIVLPRQT